MAVKCHGAIFIICLLYGGYMGLSKEALKYIEKDAQKKASELAHEAQKKLISHYEAMIDWYYRDYDPVAYVRTHNLYNSYRPFYKNSHSTIYYGGVEVTADRMHENYGTDKHPFAAADLLSTYIYTPKGTWHGGDMHGGYGVPASFSIYGQMHDYHNKLKNEYRKRCSV